ncbi:hypothetical protein [Aliivibrio fischeri]|uniref:hypothetical protein n=1 Tax=Aliivibrio fischeri TaxID=668 RepID=UPI00080E2635|nr:hypothetical protein [Aliivibrio fischeri]OCH04161.1 hypothetical protein A6E11_18815 [Aliivibrio fischeri]
MSLDVKLDLISTIATCLAVIVALGLGVVPGLLRRRNDKYLAMIHCDTSLKVIQLVINNYRKYNPITIYPTDSDEKQFQYDIDNVQGMKININLYQEVQNLNRCSLGLDSHLNKSIAELIDLTLIISSGFPVNVQEWDRLEALLSKARNDIQAKKS